jgi:phage recombination protein Bet
VKQKKQKRRPKPKAALALLEQPKPIIVQGSRVRELKREEIELLKRTVAKGTTDDEFALFLWVARKHKLDPLTRQLHCVRRWLNKHHEEERQTDTGTIRVWVAGYQMTIQMGIDGYRSLAGRDHRDFGGCDEPEYVMSSDKTPGGKLIPEKAVIRLWKKGLEHPVVGVAYWEELAPKDLADPQAFMWVKMPRHMLAKCAEALAIRKGYPELSDIYTDEEMHQTRDDYTEDGRQFTVGPTVGTAEAAQAVAERKIAEHQTKVSENKTQAENAIRGDLAVSKPKDGQSGIKKQENIILTPYRGMTALSGDGLSIIRAEMTEDDKAFFGIKLYDKSVFCLEEKLVFKFQDLCTRLGVTTSWSEPAKPVTPKNQDFTPGGLPKAKIPPALVFPDQPAPAQSTDPILFEAKVIEKEGKKPFMNLKWSGRQHSCFDKGLWPVLLAAIGKPSMFETKANGKYSNLTRIVRVDGISFEGGKNDV